ncbi:MAG: DUF1993 domain-containing protein [Acidimicrobiales bacterium]|nr:DUF1993 domain-containing protein [Hyphomonadaceae bacterium]RZV42137.1 MAG: DUF1993 domain-containing protein [Acidimicrobiales bacterium]
MTHGISFYQSSLPTLDRALVNLEHKLKKGEANAKERDIDPEVFISARLAPDMFTLAGQVDVATSLIKAVPHRLLGTTPPVYDEDLDTFEALYARIAKTRAEIGGYTAEQIDPTISRKFSIPLGPTEREFVGAEYVHGFIIPNVYFHCTTAYNILRHNGVPLGKLDFFGGGMG